MEQQLDTAVTMIAEMTVKPDKRDEFLAYTVENLALSRSAAGNIAFDILVDETQPDRVLFHEVWESARAQQEYMAWRVARGDLTTLLSYLAGEPGFRALRRVAA